MNEHKFHKASGSFYDRVEATLKAMGQSTSLSGGECQIVDEFAGLDFGVDPCSAYIVEQRAKLTNTAGSTPASNA
jgi:hypothetical protein